MDQGYRKILFFNFGMLIYFISQFFSSQKNFLYCGLHNIFKHMGIELIYFVSLLYIYSGCLLGVDVIVKKTNSNLALSSYSEINTLKKIEELLNNNNISSKISSSKDSIKKSENSISELNKNKKRYKFLKLLKRLRSLYIKGISMCIIFCIVNIFIVFIYIKKSNRDYQIVQDNDEKWIFTCPFNDYDLIINIFEFLLVSLLLKDSKKLWTLTGVFKNSIYMGYGVIIWTATGPLINVNCIIILFYLSINYITITHY